MKLTHIDIKRYRSIDEQTGFDVEPSVTALVGKNESGKTAVLQALYKSFPVDNANFDTDLDYPSHKVRELSTIDKVRVAKLTYELDEEDIKAVENVLGPNSLKGRQITIENGFRYESAIWSVSIEERAVLDSLRKDLDLTAEDMDKVRHVSTVAELISVLEGMKQPLSSSDKVLKKINSWRDQNPTYAAIDILNSRCPRFVYFGDYDVMPGKVSIPRLITRKKQKILSRGEEALLALLSIAGVDPEDFTAPESHEHLIRQMENASNTISDEVFEYWSQNKDLQVELKDILIPEASTEAPLDEVPILQVRVKNLRHRVSVPFDERSRGFVWFFSFLAYFSKLEQEAKHPLILLLDEPGLSLHATAQHDLLRFINERLAPHHQVVFTTHSPFMIDPHHFERVRTVVDDLDTGTTVQSDILKTDKESAFPLHAALGVELTQTLFVGPYVLLVEGPSDVIYLQYLSEQLIKANKPGLDERWVLVPGGGIAKLPAFLALFGANKMTVAVLSDSSVNNKEIINSLQERGKLYTNRVIQIGDVLDKTEADIEDLLPEKLYIELVNDAYQGSLAKMPLTLNDLPNGYRIVKRVEKAFNMKNINNGHFNHYSPASALLRNRDLAPGFSDKELCKVEKLINSINALLK